MAKFWRTNNGDRLCPADLISVCRGNRFSGDKDYEYKRIKPEEYKEVIFTEKHNMPFDDFIMCFCGENYCIPEIVVEALEKELNGSKIEDWGKDSSGCYYISTYDNREICLGDLI